jgi:hypothetical protein
MDRGSRSIRYTMHKKGLKVALVVKLAKLNFTYITILKKAKAWPGFDEIP